MKRSLFICLLAVLLCLSACGTPAADNPGTTDTKPIDSSTADTKPTATQPDTNPTEPEEYKFEPGYFPIPQEPADFYFTSGAGAWYSLLSINTDGTFSGRFTDSEIGTDDAGNPQGICYICDFSGVFTDVEKVNGYTYKVRLTNLEALEPVGKEWIDKEIKYIASEPYGLKDPEGKQECEEFIVYMPNAPVSELPEEFLTWWPYKNQNKDTLSCFGLMNVTTKDGFFYTPEA